MFRHQDHSDDTKNQAYDSNDRTWPLKIRLDRLYWRTGKYVIERQYNPEKDRDNELERHSHKCGNDRPDRGVTPRARRRLVNLDR